MRKLTAENYKDLIKLWIDGRPELWTDARKVTYIFSPQHVNEYDIKLYAWHCHNMVVDFDDYHGLRSVKYHTILNA